MTERVPYDEFSMFGDNAAEYDIPYAGPPAVRRESVLVSGGRKMSALVWGTESPQLVFLHGGAQNAHTWDTVILALGAHGHGPVSAVCIDLPGHGHSDSAAPFEEGAAPLAQNADDIAMVVRALAPDARCIIGMSLAEGRLLLRELMEHATQPRFVYRHAWQAHDLVIWDNRSTMHRARPFDDVRYRRELRRTTTLDIVRAAG